MASVIPYKRENREERVLICGQLRAELKALLRIDAGDRFALHWDQCRGCVLDEGYIAGHRSKLVEEFAE